MTEDDFEDKTVIADMASFTEVKPKVEGNASLVQYGERPSASAMN